MHGNKVAGYCFTWVCDHRLEQGKKGRRFEGGREGGRVVWVGAGWQETSGSGFKHPGTCSSVLPSPCPLSFFHSSCF